MVDNIKPGGFTVNVSTAFRDKGFTEYVKQQKPMPDFNSVETTPNYDVLKDMANSIVKNIVTDAKTKCDTVEHQNSN